jgi:hypothetical protein
LLAREDLAQALELATDPSEKAAVENALKDVRQLELKNKQREKEMSKNMFKFPDSKPKQ